MPVDVGLFLRAACAAATRMALALLLFVRPVLAAPADIVACRARPGPAQGGTTAQPRTPFEPRPASRFGPCTAADSVDLLPPVDGLPPVLLSNFGLLVDLGPVGTDAGAEPTGHPDADIDAPADTDAAALAGAGRRYGFVCEETYGGRNPERLARRSDGRLFLATPTGVHSLHDPAAPLCGHQRARGSVENADVVEVAFDPADHVRLFALTRSPPGLHMSYDGGSNFVVYRPLPADLRPTRLAIARTPPHTIYVAGDSPSDALLLTRVTDAQPVVETVRLPAEHFGAAGMGTVLEGPSPTDAAVLFLRAGKPDRPDEIWRSRDAGASWTRVLTLAGTEVRGGFAISANGLTIHVGGRELFPGGPGVPDAHLYVSHDAGVSFAAPLAVPATGPRFRCLANQGGRLYACGGDARDDFLFGVSDDQGRSWRPLARLPDITEPLACTSGRCFSTAFWLCQAYDVCAPGIDPQSPPEAPDSGAPDVSSKDGRMDVVDDGKAAGSGCACQMGVSGAGASPRGSVALLSLAGLAVLLRRARRGRRWA